MSSMGEKDINMFYFDRLSINKILKIFKLEYSVRRKRESLSPQKIYE